jgi:hypothetical protein
MLLYYKNLAVYAVKKIMVVFPNSAKPIILLCGQSVRLKQVSLGVLEFSDSSLGLKVSYTDSNFSWFLTILPGRHRCNP